MVEASRSGNPLLERPLLVARLDMLARNDDLQARLAQTEWDLVVVDEAHKMSASFQGTEVRETKRYRLGRQLEQVARHFVLMTATPHNGKPEDFQLFMALLDSDRFAGKFRKGTHSDEPPRDLMRRMVKEELLRFDGTPLFPERVARTAKYPLSEGEHELYEKVTEYVRTGMNRAERLRAEGQGGRSAVVGFALTILQRRLASSPLAIWRSVQRRRARLGARLAEVRDMRAALEVTQVPGGYQPDDFGDSFDDDFEPDDLLGSEVEEVETEILDAATAARTVEELEAEIADLGRLEELAEQVYRSGADRKWEELADLLQNTPEMLDAEGRRHKLIIFTEHRDTLEYLERKLTGLLGRPSAIVSIHGGVKREERRRVQDRFTQDADVTILVATDAAGEGLNLQRAHLMVNYDLPWNPNRIEQRFGRIHRIGQTNICRLWNLVADGTREGMVFERLLTKLEEQRRALGGKVFDVLGEAFSDRSLRQLLIDAIRSEDPVLQRVRMEAVIDGSVGARTQELIDAQSLLTDVLPPERTAGIRDQLERARARKLQPGFVRSFFLAALEKLGGRAARRETGRFQVAGGTRITAPLGQRQPAWPLTSELRADLLRARPSVGTRPAGCRSGSAGPSAARFHRRRDSGAPRSSLAAGHNPHRPTGLDGDAAAPGLPRTRDCGRNDGWRRAPPGRLAALRVRGDHRDGDVREAEGSPHRPAGSSGMRSVAGSGWRRQPDWVIAGLETTALPPRWRAHAPQTFSRMCKIGCSGGSERTLDAVESRLKEEIRYWGAEALRLKDKELAGKSGARLNSALAGRRATEAEERLQRRRAELALQRKLSVRQPRVVGGAVVVPAGLVAKLAGTEVPAYAHDSVRTEKLAVAAVLAAERALGRDPTEMPHNNEGYDVETRADDGRLLFVEVKGRVAGADRFTVTKPAKSTTA